MTRILSAIKCMLDCAFWYNVETGNLSEFPFASSWATITDEDIINNWNVIDNYLSTQPVLLCVKSEHLFDEMLSESAIDICALPRRSDVKTVHSVNIEKYLYVTSSNDFTVSELFAMIPTEKTRERLEVRAGYYVQSVRWLKPYAKMEFRKPLELEHGYNCVSTMGWCELNEYLYSECGDTGKSLGNGTDILIDDYYENIVNILGSQDTLMDRYNTLVTALTGIDEGLCKKLNEALKDGIIDTGNNNPLRDAIKRMSGE